DRNTIAAQAKWTSTPGASRSPSIGPCPQCGAGCAAYQRHTWNASTKAAPDSHWNWIPPFAELALPPGSAGKPYFQYVVDDPTRLPPGWHIEQSEVAPWFHQPGGGQQYRIINEEGATGDVAELVRWGYLRRIN
ncbi:TNT domain-containing protein, partial [Mycobacterium avium]|uniref:TNT domain-containing protein n=1 Tax=Mycobacterium avium TaxID=1764 RepID=UPI001E4E61A9